MAATTYPTLLQCAVVATAFKILLFPAYHSSDFEVHRNWLAITHSLPIKQWYYEKTSEWTLDYPPFFAWFEFFLSQFATWIDNAMLQVDNLKYSSWATVVFQRSTVIVTEFVLVFALYLYIKTTPPATRRQSYAIALSILLSPGLLIIDHIHFQYNGFLYGLLILSVVFARKESTLLASGATFAILLCLKHIYLYLAPAYFIYLLRAYCLDPKSILRPRFLNALKLGGTIIAITLLAFGPFALWQQLPQLQSRLFPFSRGLTHAYWAPNIWALYSFADRLLIPLAPYLHLPINHAATTSLTRGLVGDTTFAILPQITPSTCFALTLTFQIIPLTKLFTTPTYPNFLSSLTLCAYSAFLFGWHVHEKAILTLLLPFTLVALNDRSHLASFRPLAVAGHVALFPLLFTPAEFPIKLIYTIVWLVSFLVAFDRLAPVPTRRRVFLLDRFSVLYIAIAMPLVAYCSLVHNIVFGADRYEFLPLMFMSTYCAVGVVCSWIGFLTCYLT